MFTDVKEPGHRDALRRCNANGHRARFNVRLMAILLPSRCAVRSRLYGNASDARRGSLTNTGFALSRLASFHRTGAHRISPLIDTALLRVCLQESPKTAPFWPLIVTAWLSRRRSPFSFILPPSHTEKTAAGCNLPANPATMKAPPLVDSIHAPRRLRPFSPSVHDIRPNNCAD